MKKLISSGRLIGGGIVLALLLVLYFSVLFKLQVIEGRDGSGLPGQHSGPLRPFAGVQPYLL